MILNCSSLSHLFQKCALPILSSLSIDRDGRHALGKLRVVVVLWPLLQQYADYESNLDDAAVEFFCALARLSNNASIRKTIAKK